MSDKQTTSKEMQTTLFSSHKPSPAFFDYILPDQSIVQLKQGLQHFQHLFQTEKQQIQYLRINIQIYITLNILLFRSGPGCSEVG